MMDGGGKKRRPWVLPLLFVAVGLANAVRAGMAWYVAPALMGQPLSVSLPLLGVFYGLWALLFVVAGAALWGGRGLRLALPLAGAYQLALWALRLLAGRSGYLRAVWARDALLSLGFLALAAFFAWRAALNMSHEM